MYNFKPLKENNNKPSPQNFILPQYIFKILGSYVFTVIKDKHFPLLKRSFPCTFSGQTHQKPSVFEMFSYVIRWSSVTTNKHLHLCRLHENFVPKQ